MEGKRYLVTDSKNNMEIFYESELSLIEGLKEFDSMTVEPYIKEDIPADSEIVDLDKVPF